MPLDVSERTCTGSHVVDPFWINDLRILGREPAGAWLLNALDDCECLASLVLERGLMGLRVEHNGLASDWRRYRNSYPCTMRGNRRAKEEQQRKKALQGAAEEPMV